MSTIETDRTAGDTGPSLTARTARGFTWMVAQQIVTKSLDIVGQFVLGILLLGDEWGVIGLAVAVRTFSDVLRRTGLRQVLVQRHRHFDRWATPGFWMALLVGLAAMILMLLAAPLVASIYDDKRLIMMMVVLALVPPLGALGTVPVAKLQSDLRFRALALSEGSCRILQTILRVGLVVVGLGPLGYVLADPVAEAGRTIAYWCLTRPRIRMTPQWRRWRFLLVDSGWMFLATNANKLVEQADKLVLGLFHVKDSVGAYFWAYMVSRQAIDMFVWNLEKILLPALSHLQLDPQRQVQAFLRAARMLAITVVPACLMLAAIIDPLLHFVYPGGTRHDSIPVIQIVSTAMSMWVIYGPTASLIKAQGRFRLFMIVTWSYAALFLTAVILTAWYSSAKKWHGEISMAAAVAVCMTAFGPIQAYMGIRPGGGTWMDVARIYLPPITLGLLAVGGGLMLAETTPAIAASHLLRIAVTVIVGTGLYLILLRAVMPATFRELLDQVAHFRPNRRGG